ncbi:RAB small monomeric GTPase, variant 2 [Coprinopsis cinerea AmutBmut pab1-1]|nr:RAB small monomeric GTPase, variant 2 [Coprinopsis cinerea AmutBmut pab1-1]
MEGFCCVVVGNKTDLLDDENRVGEEIVTKEEALTFLDDLIPSSSATPTTETIPNSLLPTTPSPPANSRLPLLRPAKSHSQFDRFASIRSTSTVGTTTDTAFFTPSSSFWEPSVVGPSTPTSASTSSSSSLLSSGLPHSTGRGRSLSVNARTSASPSVSSFSSVYATPRSSSIASSARLSSKSSLLSFATAISRQPTSPTPGGSTIHSPVKATSPLPSQSPLSKSILNSPPTRKSPKVTTTTTPLNGVPPRRRRHSTSSTESALTITPGLFAQKVKESSLERTSLNSTASGSSSSSSSTATVSTTRTTPAETSPILRQVNGTSPHISISPSKAWKGKARAVDPSFDYAYPGPFFPPSRRSSRKHETPPANRDSEGKDDKGPVLFLTSAKSRSGVEEVFEYVVRRVCWAWEASDDDEAEGLFGSMDADFYGDGALTSRGKSRREREGTCGTDAKFFSVYGMESRTSFGSGNGIRGRGRGGARGRGKARNGKSVDLRHVNGNGSGGRNGDANSLGMACCA